MYNNIHSFFIIFFFNFATLLDLQKSLGKTEISHITHTTYLKKVHIWIICELPLKYAIMSDTIVEKRW